MDYEIKVSESGKFVVVKVFKEMTVEKGQQTAIESQSLASQKGIKSFLYDVRDAPNTESPTSNYQFAYKGMPKFQGQRESKVAILTSPDDESHDFLITVMTNAGYNVKRFTDEEPALNWLE
ncbi:MAG: hypothetical protein IPM56_00255 [Ignavibacteriales bacterium]|nr:MAG: hypothetical protein IPM56_00255 [Ignavibacteriales bacterium]